MRHTTTLVSVILLVAMVAIAQAPPPWTVVRYPKDKPFTSILLPVSAPGGCEQCDVYYGKVTITRDDQHTRIDFDIRNLPKDPGRYYVYAVDESKGAKKLATFGTSYQATREFPVDEYEAFMLIVSADGNLRMLPARDKILLVTTVPAGLKVARRAD